jgi:hypothetical protein
MKKVTAWRLCDCMEDRESSSPETEFRAVDRHLRERKGGREKVNLTLSKASPGADITA